MAYVIRGRGRGFPFCLPSIALSAADAAAISGGTYKNAFTLEEAMHLFYRLDTITVTFPAISSSVDVVSDYSAYGTPPVNRGYASASASASLDSVTLDLDPYIYTSALTAIDVDLPVKRACTYLNTGWGNRYNSAFTAYDNSNTDNVIDSDDLAYARAYAFCNHYAAPISGGIYRGIYDGDTVAYIVTSSAAVGVTVNAASYGRIGFPNAAESDSYSHLIYGWSGGTTPTSGRSFVAVDVDGIDWWFEERETAGSDFSSGATDDGATETYDGTMTTGKATLSASVFT